MILRKRPFLLLNPMVLYNYGIWAETLIFLLVRLKILLISAKVFYGCVEKVMKYYKDNKTSQNSI